MKNFLGIVLFLVFTSPHAALIDSGTFFTDTDSGLDWLKLASSIDRSYNDVSSKLGAGQEFDGWHYASSAEFEQVLLNAGLLPDSSYSTLYFYTPCIAGVNFCGNGGRGIDLPAKAQMTAMSDLFGNLANQLPANLSPVANTVGLLSDVDSGNIDPTAHFTGEIFWADAIAGGINSFGLSRAPGDEITGVGSYLVRTSTVPVPAAAWLFGSGLLGLFGMARKRSR